MKRTPIQRHTPLSRTGPIRTRRKRSTPERSVGFDLRAFAKDQACTLRLDGICNRDPTTTVLCHVRLFGASGGGQKPPDLCAFHGCSACHAAEATASDGDILRAVLETLRRVCAHPKSVLPRDRV